MDIYITVGVSESPPPVFVLQAFAPNRRVLSCAFPVSEISGWETNDVPSVIGYLIMEALSGPESVVDQYPRLLVIDSPRQLKHATTVCPVTRPSHLRISVAKETKRLVFQHCTDGAGGEVVASLSLPRLALAGAAAAGEFLLRATQTLHPDVFAPLEKKPG